jgi:hypothetical protein
MACVEVELNGGPWVLIAGVLGLVCGAAAWWYGDFCSGLFAYLGVGCGLLLARQLWFQAWLPSDARRASNCVLAWFRQRFPNERVDSVAVRAVEPGRYVIAVRHGFGIPTPRSYFAVARSDLTNILELPVADWWPRGLK